MLSKSFTKLCYRISVHCCRNSYLCNTFGATNRIRLTVLNVVRNTVKLNSVGCCRGIDDLACQAICLRIRIGVAILITPNRQFRAIRESILANAHKAIGQNDRIEIVTTAERLIPYCCQGLICYDTNKIVSIVKGALAYLGDAFCQCYAIYSIVVSKKSIAKLDDLLFDPVNCYCCGNIDVGSSTIIFGHHYPVTICLGFPQGLLYIV